MKAKRALLNITVSAVSKLSSIIFGIIIPKLFIVNFGSDINGFMSSITGIFVYINLLEAGVGGASIQALYKPITDNDQDKINRILSATNKYYKRTGVYFLACVSALAFLYPVAARSDISYFTIVTVILLSSLPSVLTYFFQGKYSVLLLADNRGYKLTEFYIIFNAVSNICKIVMILVGFDIIKIQLVFSLISILQVFAVTAYIKKTYPSLNLRVEPDNKAIVQKNSVIIHQIASTVLNNTDVLILTFFLDFKIVSVYTVYNMIFSHAKSIPTMVSDGLSAGFGQLYFEDRQKFNKLYDFFEVTYYALVYIVFIIAYLLVIPFIRLYTSGVTDINYVDYLLPMLFLAANILNTARYPASVAITVAGHFKQTKYRALLEMIINLSCSLILVNFLGIYGVLIGTIAAFLYRTNDMIIYAARHILNRKVSITYRRLLLNLLLGMLTILLFKSINIAMLSYVQILIVGAVMFVAVGMLYAVAILCMEKDIKGVLLEYFSVFRNKVKGYM